MALPTAQQAAQAWLQGAQGAQTKWVTNLTNTQADIVGRAIANSNVAVSNYSQSINSGRWAAALQAVGNAGIKAAASAKQANYGTGIQAGESKYAAKIGPILAYIGAGLPQLESMPSGTTAAGVARATFWIQYMAGAKGL